MYRFMRASNMAEFRSSQPIEDDVICRVAPSVFARHAHESRSERYGFLPTSVVLDGLRQEGFEPFEVRQTRCRDQGKRAFTKHMLRLRHRAVEVGGGESELPEIVLLNSHDGTSAYKLISGVFRMVCSNGLISGRVDEDVSVRHNKNVVDQVIEGSYRVLGRCTQIIGQVGDWKRIGLSARERAVFADAASELKWERDRRPVEPRQLVAPRRQADRREDLWTTFNVVQEHLHRRSCRPHHRQSAYDHARGHRGHGKRAAQSRAVASGRGNGAAENRVTAATPRP